MHLTGMGQLAVAVKESLKTLAIDDYTEGSGKVSSIQNRYIDSVELSDRAIQLSMKADTETGFEEETVTDQGQEEVPAANPLQEVITRALSLNALA